MKTLAIYHAPQECGQPYVLLINLENGQIVRTISIPEGYSFSGFEVEEYYEPTGEIVIKKYSGTCLPSIGSTEWERRDKKIMLSEIKDVQNWEFPLGGDEFFKGYDATLCYNVVRRKLSYKFDAKKDTFRKGLEEQGINMKGWCVYKRRKTDFNEFLKAILPSDVVNIIHIG